MQQHESFPGCLDDALDFYHAFFPIRSEEFGICHSWTSVCMQDFSIACIDGNMGDPVRSIFGRRLHEDQVALLQILFGDRFSDGRLLTGVARQRDSRLLKDALRKR